MPVLRAADTDDLEVLSDIERAAGELFRPLGMDRIADDDPPPVATLQGFVENGWAWVVEEDGEVAGYLLADVVDGCATSSRSPSTRAVPDEASGGLSSSTWPAGPSPVTCLP